MVLDSETVSQIRQALSDGNLRLIIRQTVEGVTLAGLLELCCAFRSWGERRTEGSAELFDYLRAQTPLLAPVAALFKETSRNPTRMAGAALVSDEIMLQAFGNAEDYRSDFQAWDRFKDGFVRRLQQAGIDRNWSYALASVLTEIVNNVPDHSKPPGQPTSPALVGCHIKPGHVHFAVGDLGDGALVSLLRNPRWQHLSGPRQALLAIIEKNPTAKAQHAEGSGFKQLFAAFANRGGLMRLLSGEAVAAVSLSEQGDRTATTSTCANLAGMHVSASWLMRGKPTESILQQNSLTHEFG